MMGSTMCNFRKGCRCGSSWSATEPRRNDKQPLLSSAGRTGLFARRAAKPAIARSSAKGCRTQCSANREQTPVMCETIFEATKLPLTTWSLAMHLLTQSKNNVSALELKRHLGVRYKTDWLLKYKLIQVMSEREELRQLDGRVEIDDAYLGGGLPGGKSGRGSENKVSFIAAVQTTDTGHPLKVRLKKLEFTKEAIAEWVKMALTTSAEMASDGL